MESAKSWDSPEPRKCRPSHWSQLYLPSTHTPQLGTQDQAVILRPCPIPEESWEPRMRLESPTCGCSYNSIPLGVTGASPLCRGALQSLEGRHGNPSPAHSGPLGLRGLQTPSKSGSR